MNALHERMIENAKICEITNDDEFGTFLENPIIYLCEVKKLKLCVDPRFLNSVTKLVSIPFAVEPIQNLLAKLTAKIFPISDSSNAYHQVLLTEENVMRFSPEKNKTLIAPVVMA